MNVGELIDFLFQQMEQGQIRRSTEVTNMVHSNLDVCVSEELDGERTVRLHRHGMSD